MNVYVLVEGIKYERADVVGVFGTRALAEAAAIKLTERGRYQPYHRDADRWVDDWSDHYVSIEQHVLLTSEDSSK